MTNEQMEVEIVLQELDKVRWAEDKAMPLINTLIQRGIYPTDTVPGNSSTILQMVRGWGPWWFEWKGILNCPHCKVDLRDHTLGPPFKMEVAVYSMEQDRTTHYECRECKGVWDRT